MQTTFLCSVDTSKVDELMKDTNKNVEYFETTVSSIVSSYLEDLNSLMSNIKDDIINTENPSTNTIEKYFLELTNLMYFISEKAEKLNIYSSMSKSAYKEVYNKAYLSNQIKDIDKKNKTTVAENQAVAENASIYENAVNEIYSEAYKIIKLKLDSAQTMISTLSKCLSKRIQESQLSTVNISSASIKNSRILNEDYNTTCDGIYTLFNKRGNN